MSTKNQNSISWEAWEFKHYHKNLGWYVTVISVSIVVVSFFAFVQNDIFAAVSLGIIALLILAFSKQKPQKVMVELTEKGVHFGNLFYPYKQLKYFWVVSNNNHKTLNFHTSAYINNILIIQLDDQDPEAVTEFLLKLLPEHTETEETLTQKIMHHTKF